MRDSLASLANLGPKSLNILARAGITSEAQLRRLGSVQAYLETEAHADNTGLKLLWSLEGALTDRCWRDVYRAPDERVRLLQLLEDARQIRIAPPGDTTALGATPVPSAEANPRTPDH